MSRRWQWILGAIVLILVVGYVALRLIDEPLRRRVEAGMNASLKGYRVRLGQLHFHPIGASVDLVDWVIVQEANPDPPIARIPKLHASIEWMALFHGHLVADFRFERPAFHVDLRHAEHEAKDPTPVSQKGWQEAAFAAYPLRINLLRIVDGEATYVDEGPLRPIHVTGLNFRAGNIRNARSKPGEYPSDVHLSGTILDTAKLRVDGHADFFAEPIAAIEASYDLAGMHLDYLEPILHHWDVSVKRGTLATRGEIEYGPKVKTVHLADATVDGADVTYLKRRSGQATPTEKAPKAAAAVMQQPSVAVRADRMKIADSTLAYRDETTDPPYRLFVDHCTISVNDFTNVRSASDGGGPGKATIRAKFMNSGDTRVDGTFEPRENHTDFDIALQIENSDLRAMNDLWRAYGKFDVDKGTFSLYSELKARNGAIDGYVKPIFHDIGIDTGDQAGVGKKIYEGIVAGATKILTNPPHDQVATETRLSGRLDDPHTSILQVTGNLVRNAFFQAILPGLKHQ